MNSVVIVAGGKGTRMGANTPKQFLLLNGVPILMHTIQAFLRWDKNAEIVLVLPKTEQEQWNELVGKHNFTTQLTLTTGGATRFDSVYKGLQKTTGDIVAIHDGVRPLVSSQTIQNCFDAAVKHGNGIPCIPINDSIRKTNGDENQMVNRENYFRIQTPQVFQRSVILDGFKQPYSDAFTDDASVIEKAGEKIYLVDGNEENIKITRPSDLKIAEVFI